MADPDFKSRTPWLKSSGLLYQATLSSDNIRMNVSSMSLEFCSLVQVLALTPPPKQIQVTIPTHPRLPIQPCPRDRTVKESPILILVIENKWLEGYRKVL